MYLFHCKKITFNLFKHKHYFCSIVLFAPSLQLFLLVCSLNNVYDLFLPLDPSPLCGEQISLSSVKNDIKLVLLKILKENFNYNTNRVDPKKVYLIWAPKSTEYKLHCQAFTEE